jgi:hypothetical protein
VRPRTVRQAHAVADLCDELSGFFTRLHRPESAVWLVDTADALRTATDASEVRDRCRRVRSVLSQGWGGPGDLTVTTTEGAVDGPADDRYRALLHEACARAAPYPDWLRWVVPYAVVAIAVVAAAIFHIVWLWILLGVAALAFLVVVLRLTVFASWRDSPRRRQRRADRDSGLRG